MTTPLRDLVSRTLAPTLPVFDDAVSAGREGVIGGGVGLDVMTGERILASAEEIIRPKKGIEHRLVLAITDSRTCLSGVSTIKGGFNGKGGSALFNELTGMSSKDGLMSAYVKLQHPAGELTLTFAGTKNLIAFYEGLKQIPAAQRVAPPVPLTSPSADDPTGAQSARMGLLRPDSTAEMLFATIEQAVAANAYDVQSGAELVRRVALSARIRLAGAGGAKGRWLCALPAMDLGPLLFHLFGQGQHTTPQPGVHSIDFANFQRANQGRPVWRKAFGAAVAVDKAFSDPTKMVGQAIASAMMKKQPVKVLRFMFADLEGCSGFRTLSPNQSLSSYDAILAYQIHVALARATDAVLARRVHVGWQVPFEQLGISI